MPKFGESIVEGTIGRWLKQPGEWIERDEPLVEIQTDKVNADVPSPVAGVVQQLLLPDGATAAVGTDIAVIGDVPLASAPGPISGHPASEPHVPGLPGQPSELDEQLETAVRSGSPASPPRVAHAELAHRDPPAEHVDPSRVARRLYTPVVLRMAQEHGLDLAAIDGSGLGGRVTRKDVERFLGEGPLTPGPIQPTAKQAAVSTLPPLAVPSRPAHAVPTAEPERRPLTPMRRAIADHVSQARRDIPDAWATVEVDVTGLASYRASARAEWLAREGHELSYLPFFLKAVVAGLRAVPELNASWAGDHVVVHREYHVGIAVALEQGLVVPVLRSVDGFSVAGLARALSALVEKARSGRLVAEDLQGATFTLNNTGALGSVLSQPVVPLGQAGIVTMEAVVKRPVVIAGDGIAVRSVMNCCLSFDHRIIDGAQALRFLRTLKGQLETVSDEP